LATATAEAVQALRDQGVRAILIKGPTIAQWLYDDPADRPYQDIDLMVAPDRYGTAEEILGGLGYRTPAVRAAERPSHARGWTRQGPCPPGCGGGVCP
jgi:hypothetical protein